MQPHILLLLVIFVIVLALAISHGVGGVEGGAAPRRPASPHLVVDTLNLLHALRPGAPVSQEAICALIDEVSPALVARHPGQVMFVLKDRESRHLEEGKELAPLQAAAARNRVYVCIARRYQAPPSDDIGPAATEEDAHADRGRDDYYMCLLAHRLRCAVLTNDRLRDFARLRARVRPFYVTELAYWRDRPASEYIRPTAEPVFRRPRLLRPAEAGLSVPSTPAPSTPRQALSGASIAA